MNFVLAQEAQPVSSVPDLNPKQLKKIQFFDTRHEIVTEFTVPAGYEIVHSSPFSLELQKGEASLYLRFHENLNLSPMHLERLSKAPKTVQKYFAQEIPSESELKLAKSEYLREDHSFLCEFKGDGQSYFFAIKLVDQGVLSLASKQAEVERTFHPQVDWQAWTYEAPKSSSEVFSSLSSGLYVFIILLLYVVVTRFLRKKS